MSKRQKRINVEGNTNVLLEYKEQEVSVVCSSGAVFHGVLYKVDKEFIDLKDASGNIVKLLTKELKELIIDYVSR